MRLDLDKRFEQIQFRYFLSGEKWDSLKNHLEKFVEFENFLMDKKNISREKANVFIGDFIINNFGESGSDGSLESRRNTINIISLTLGDFSIREGFDISESIQYIYYFQENEKVLIMATMFGLREELIYY
jgi:hypothetical protein